MLFVQFHEDNQYFTSKWANNFVSLNNIFYVKTQFQKMRRKQTN